jgi:3-hydroxybutyryl-CoA dehydratase
MTPTQSYRSSFTLGETETFAKTLTDADVSGYAGLVGDFHPLHVDAEYARRSRFGQRTAHGMLAAGLVSALMNTRLPGPTATCLSQQMEFLNPIFIGDTITARVEVIAWNMDKRLLTLRTDCFNQEKVQVLTGQAVLLLNNGDS